MELLGINVLKKKLKDLAEEAKQSSVASVTVGYTQNYGLSVHENLQAHHPHGEAKFLEKPAREKIAIYAKIVSQAYRKGLTLEQALLLAGLRLQRESQLIVPVDTTALKASAFTSLTREVEAAAQEAYARSEVI